jgi:hypothetical protein
MKLVAGFFVLLLISGISVASAASIISIELDSDTLVAGEIVEISGTVESSLAGQPVGIEVKDSEGEIILIRSITTDSNGNFTLKFKVPSSASGNLEIITSVEIDGQSFSESISATVAVPELFEEEPEPEPIAQQVAEPEVKSQTSVECDQGMVVVDGICRFAPEESSEGCGEGTVMVNGVCQVAKTSGTSMAIEPIYLIIGVVAIGGIIGAIAVAKRGSKTPKPAKQELDEYEEQYLTKPKRKPKPTKQKHVEKEETSSSCSNCGNTLNPKAKFCGSCGNQV